MGLSLTPACGRDYKSKKAVLADWDANLFFVINNYGPDMGRMCTKSDAHASGERTVSIRYDRLMKQIVVKVEAVMEDDS